MATTTTMATVGIIMSKEPWRCPEFAWQRRQNWLSPAFPTGAYSYSHSLEWAVEAGHIKDRESLVDWLDADLRFGSGRNEAIFFSEAWRGARDENSAKLFEIAELAGAFPGASEFSLLSSHHGSARPATLPPMWAEGRLESVSRLLSELDAPTALAV